ncbi:MAG: NAD-dependent epimerase/dehydratase family protein [Anaerolineae bacterium]|nr:NAD-dependent epimerase/dehydratase family protein [Anaerolineae bacterium]
MKILMIGGTRFVGRHMAAAALKRGHDITLFHRGKTNPDVFPQVEYIYGDRDGQLEVLKNRTWDVVIDTSGYVPRVVRQSVELLRESVSRYIFISTISVYRDLDTRANEDENGALMTLADETTEVITPETYGALKALCEKVVMDTAPALIIRPGLVVGPEDYTLRFTYWPMRVSYGGQMLTPPEFKMQFIDARDLAEWTIHMAEQQQTGIFNATGQPVPLSDVLETSRMLTGKEIQFIPVSESFLQEHEVNLPLWFPSSIVGVHTLNIQRALNAGLTFRPLADTIHDTLVDGQRQENPLRAGLSLEQEAELLQKWQSSQVLIGE